MFRLINKLKNRKGFTLIELIVVLAVLAIIMAIAVPRFLGVQETAKKDADKGTAASIAKAAELYVISENKSLPTSVDLSDLAASGKYLDSDTKFQYYGNTSGGALADVTISVDAEGRAKVVGKDGGTNVTLYD